LRTLEERVKLKKRDHKMKKKTILFTSGGMALIASFLCCAGPILGLLLGTGAAASASAWSAKWQPVLWAISFLAFALAGWQYFKKRKPDNKVELQSVLTCPHCGFQQKETMPTDACQYYYECRQCKTLLKPKTGDCCVFCSYGSVKCPPVQQEISCCKT
jgi:hypothetical protein